MAYAAQQPGERLQGEGVVERVRAQPGDAGDLLRVADHVHREPLARPGLGEVEPGALRTGQQQPQRERALAGARRGLGESVPPAQPARLGEVDDQMGAVGGQVEELAVAGHRRDGVAFERAQRRVVGLQDTHRDGEDTGDLPAGGALGQDRGEGLHLGQLRHATSVPQG
ncbi:hypothetical protein SSPO_015620 [Streptomyces antimycoticus]|uniref:Uncharacterized protein n=1 Tax=Streptomyces antimycoticus TaxID=68175 RepID=A0A499UCP1_9ACTN|nr:hypothetical protein SSPO_015620 [Streptomyces antimycoticus]